MKTYIRNIYDLREHKGLKQSDIAKIIGTTQQQYSKYETGETELTLRALVALADYYNVSTDYLLGRKGNWNDAPAMERKVCSQHTLRSVIKNLLSLSKTGRLAVVDYISLQINNQAYMKLKAKEKSVPFDDDGSGL